MTCSLAHRRRLVALFSSAMLSIVACHRPGAAGDTPDDTPAVIPTPISAQLDSVRGTLLLVGNEPVATLLLAAIDRNSEPVAVTGALIPVLRRVIGLEIVVFGHKTGARAPDASPRGAPVFDVHSFVVRAADGVAAHDGVVEFKSSKWLLRLVDGRELPVTVMPALLRQQIGARVWIAGSLDGAPASYGLIIAAR